MKIFLIGAGHMGGAIARALRPAHKVYVYDRHARRAKISGTTFALSLKDLSSAKVVIVAVKPQDMPALAVQIKDRINPSAILISIAAGVNLKKLAELFTHKKTIRIMPSLALTVGQGVAFWKSAKAVSAKEKVLVSKLFSSFTEHYEVSSERLIDSGSIIYASGPAYFFLLAQHLQEAAQSLGISAALSRRLVEKTFLGSALLQAGQDYRGLVAKIASKKGITEAALKVFSRRHLGQIIKQGVVAGFKRTRQLSHG